MDEVFDGCGPDRGPLRCATMRKDATPYPPEFRERYIREGWLARRDDRAGNRDGCPRASERCRHRLRRTLTSRNCSKTRAGSATFSPATVSNAAAGLSFSFPTRLNSPASHWRVSTWAHSRDGVAGICDVRNLSISPDSRRRKRSRLRPNIGVFDHARLARNCATMYRRLRCDLQLLARQRMHRPVRFCAFRRTTRAGRWRSI